MTHIKKFIMQHNLIKLHDKLLIGLSGGADSVFLLHLLYQLKDEFNLTLTALHINHEWRASALIDEQFCKELCNQLSIPLLVKRASEVPTGIIKQRGSKEDAARQLRQYFFTTTLQALKYDRIALGHNLNDQEENFFIRVIRGSSLTGLCGIKSNDGDYIRPLIETSKESILAYLHTHGITYAVDPTNESMDYLRNRIRMHIIPVLKECDQRFDANFLRTQAKLQEADNFIKDVTNDMFNTVVTDAKINIKQLIIQHQFLQKQIVLQWLIASRVSFELTDSFIEEVLKFLTSERGGKHTFNNWVIEKKQHIATIVIL